MKSRVFNLIIVDKSGSMHTVTDATIAGVNETIGGIQASARRNSEQEQYISLLFFCGCERKYIFDNAPAEKARFIDRMDYRPCCNTPLYDAVGYACIGLDHQVGDDPAAAVCVTIITDGYENSSRQFTRNGIINLIREFKQKGWMFAYMGADHDVKGVARELNIDNVMEFTKNKEDMKRMFMEYKRSRERYVNEFEHDITKSEDFDRLSKEEIIARKKKLARQFFSKEKE